LTIFFLVYLVADQKIINLHFYGALDKGSTVPFDAASALWQFAARHASDYLRGNLTPALVEWSRFLNNLRSICNGN
jgi:hypothetical protein